MDFRKYHEIDAYTAKWLADWLRRFPGIESEAMAVTEKIDGANFQMVFEPGEAVQFASRNQILGDRASGFDFFDAEDAVIGGCAKLMDAVQRYAEENSQAVRLYGELFGGKIQGRVDYGADKCYRVFDVALGDEYLPWERVTGFFAALGLPYWLVPELGVMSLADALALDIEKPSRLSPADGLCEGVVVKPNTRDFYKVFPDFKERFIFKRKNERFAEIRKPRPPKAQVAIPPEVAAMQAEFAGYITRNRLLSAVSKLGELTSPKQIGVFLPELITDAKADFLKEHDLGGMGRDAAKMVFRPGADAARRVITDYLREA